ncbi:MAG: hypothetical protein K8W52_26870 [Deltaproteobacteria bacterium]|nr:hypothetical protein [Deltaproteobacteria bacterium]
MDEHALPAERRDALLDILAELIARGGAGAFLASPVIPGEDAFPEPWQPTRAGVTALLRRLAWHAGIPRAIEVTDARLGAPPTERRPATRVELTAVRPAALGFRLEFIGADDVAGTLAHELGVAHAVLNRPGAAEPYRSTAPTDLEVDPGRDHERGSIATIYLGLGVLATNAAFQQYSRAGRFNGAYSPLEYDVLRAGHVPMSELAFLLAVQSVVRGTDAPAGLEGPQRDEVSTWLRVLGGQRTELRARLGIAADAVAAARPEVVPFDDVELEAEAPPARTAFRWRTHRGGVGFIGGIMIGAGLAATIASRGLAPLCLLGGASVGHVVGRGVSVPRCSNCASVVPAAATRCPHCGASLRGDIKRLDDRLEAEEQLEAGADAGP